MPAEPRRWYDACDEEPDDVGALSDCDGDIWRPEAGPDGVWWVLYDRHTGERGTNPLRWRELVRSYWPLTEALGRAVPRG